MERDEVFSELTKRGVAKAVVEFSGDGDVGIDDVALVDADGVELGKLQQKHGCAIYTHTDENSNKPKSDEELFEALSCPIRHKYDGRSSELYVSGEVVWDVATQRVTMEGGETVQHSSEFEEEV